MSHCVLEDLSNCLLSVGSRHGSRMMSLDSLNWYAIAKRKTELLVTWLKTVVIISFVEVLIK